MMELGDDDLLPEFEAQVAALEQDFTRRKTDLLFSGPYDNREAVVRISAGVGGLDAQDFAAMLERMYLRWAERSGMKVDTLERSTNDDAGIKTAVLEISGPFAYGKLRSENGVHRLVRLSPFNADNLRQTSFALVEVLPKIDTPDEIAIDPNDLRIDVYRSGGKGGQGVNTTDSAANWGSQIRNYVLHPYTLVKDTRTKYENRNAQGVLDGDIDEFIEAYLRKTQ